MFAEVEYYGFDGRPDLRALAEAGTRLLADETGAEWQDRIGVRWAVLPARPELELAVTLTLPAQVGVGRQTASAADLADPERFRDWVRRGWTRALDNYLDRRKPAWDEVIRQPYEV